ncbi:MAG: response regulator [Chitinophagaceae bacterium]|nr:response regulator [Chitinophagaceae bacterium]
MKRFYILLFLVPVVAFSLLYFSIWWFLIGLALVMTFVIYRFIAERFATAETNKEMLENELEDLHLRLEKSVIKEQKTNKEVEEARQIKQALLSVLSHEIRTPMNGVLGMSLLLADTTLTKEQQEYNNTIRSCGESLLTTINELLANDILFFSKLQQEGNQLEYTDFDLRDAVEETIGLFADKTSRLDIELICEVDKDVPKQIIGDPNRLRKLLINLLDNAVKFTVKGEIHVSVILKPDAETGYPPVLVFEVRDTGIGISGERLKKIFTGIPGKDFRAEGSDVQGLGLVVCRKLVSVMGGTIEAKSQEGRGSIFTFSLPLTPSLKLTRNQERQLHLNVLEGKTVLIVDDNSTHRTMLMKQFMQWKMNPLQASSGEQALHILKDEKQKFDLVLTDLTLIGMDGSELAGAIKNGHDDTPVLLMRPTGKECKENNIDLFAGVLMKPIRQYALEENLVNVFRTKSQPISIKPLSEHFGATFPLKILVAEDNLINQKIISKILSKLGYEATVANNGKEALEIVSNEPFDIILMDVQMPEMDGLEATRMIRTCLEVQPVIIALTANVMQGDRDACMQAGMDDYLSKPVELKELMAQLEKWAVDIKAKRA